MDSPLVSSTRFIYQLLSLFRQVSQMPEDRLKILPWDKKTEKFKGESPSALEAVMHSTRYDIENDNWQAGVVVYFDPPTHTPRQYVTFVLIVAEHDLKFTARIGEPGKPQQIDLNVQTQAEQFFKSIVEDIKEAMKEPAKKNRRIVMHGFAEPD